MADASALAVEETQRMLTSNFEGLEHWRNQALQNPRAKADSDAGDAVVPYHRMANAMQKSMYRYQLQARAMASQATQLANEANAMNAQAQAKNADGDRIGAAQDIEQARALQGDAAVHVDQAQHLWAAAQHTNNMASQYLGAADVAATRARYEADANGMPPLLTDPAVSFTPPPSR